MGRKFLLLLAWMAFKWGLKKITEDSKAKPKPPLAWKAPFTKSVH